MVCAERTGSISDIAAACAALQPERRPGRGDDKKKHKRAYTEECAAFDIEVTSLPKYQIGVIYQWQLQIGPYITITGRYASEIPEAFREIEKALARSGRTIVCWVHNLSYEFQFLRSLVPEMHDIFATDIRQPLKLDIGHHIEVRCSYLQSGVSLAKLTATYHAEHGKLSGDLDYRVIRYPWTPLTEIETAYCIFDVRGLVEAMTARRDERRDSWASMPLTKTGYIRRRIKVALHHYKRVAYALQSDYEVYKTLRRAFRGGNTHANRMYAGRIIGPVWEWDRSSSYPDVIVNCLFPNGKWQEVDAADFEKYYKRGSHAMLLDIALVDVSLTDPLYPVPYLSVDKCRSILDPVKDNGRIISASYLETTVTDVDMQIILEQYNFELQVKTLRVSKYQKLPPELTRVVIDLYHDKTALKGVAGREQDYALAKEDINSCYGMMVQDPGKPDILYSDELEDWQLDDTDPEASYLQRVKNTPLLYCWGVWVTAWARWMLEQAIKVAGTDFVYCDTDSVYSLSPIDLNAFNADRRKASKASGAYATDPKGVTHYMGVFEQEGGVIDRFITWGAKKYAYEIGGTLHITIAGVGKKTGAAELAEHGGLEALRPGFVFRAAGGTKSLYNDKKYGIIKEEGRELDVGTSIYIEDSTYTLGVTDEYAKLLSLTKEQLQKLKYLMKTQEEMNMANDMMMYNSNNLSIQEQADTIAENGSGVWVPFSPETREDKATLYNALTSTGVKLSEYVGDTLSIANMVIQGCHFTDEETGKVEPGSRLILVGPEGQIYKSTSRGMIRAAVQLVEMFGTPDQWGGPLTITIERVQLRKGYTYNFKVVG